VSMDAQHPEQLANSSHPVDEALGEGYFRNSSSSQARCSPT
jgi:hypothetical protein